MQRYLILSRPSSSSSTFYMTAAAATTNLFNSNEQQPNPKKNNSQKKSIAIIGGGASGIFAAIHASSSTTTAAASSNIEVTVLEATSQVLQKVKISGGGRCNVLHDATIPTEIILQKGYPRGYKELRSICLSQYPIAKAAEWFRQHNVPLKTEGDGRMFPITDTSQTVIDALIETATIQNHVTIQYRSKVLQIIPPLLSSLSNDNNNNNNNNIRNKFQVICSTKSDSNTNPTTSRLLFDAVIVATGSAPAGYALVAEASVQQQQGQKNRTGLNMSDSILKDNDNDSTTGSRDITIVGNGSDERTTAAAVTLSNDTKSNSTIHHPFVSSLPSLFTFNCKHAVSSSSSSNEKGDDGILAGLAGVSVSKVRVTFTPIPTAATISITTTKAKKKIPAHLIQEGPILITHHGLSGPAILRLSAFGARDMALYQYRGIITINWIPDVFDTREECFNVLWDMTMSNPKKTIASQCPILLPTLPSTTTSTTTAIPKRLWQSLVRSSDISDTLCWGNVNKQMIRKLSEQLLSCRIEMTSKSTNKEEFVTSGGIDLSSIHMKTMQSKRISGLFFCGELLNVDGITGGFNFYNCWSTGYVAGTSAAAYIVQQQQEENDDQHHQQQSSR